MQASILDLIADAQRAGRLCAVIDTDHSFDTDRAVAMGVNLTDVLISQPDSAEQAYEICDTLVRTRAIDLIVYTVPRDEVAPALVERLAKTRTVLVVSDGTLNAEAA